MKIPKIGMNMPKIGIAKIALFVAILGIFATGCASTPDRWLTAEEDADLRSKCEPHGGCTAIPKPLWDRIEQLIRSMAGTAI